MQNRKYPISMKSVYDLLASSEFGIDSVGDAFEAYFLKSQVDLTYLNAKFNGETLLICATRKRQIRAVRLLVGYEEIDCNVTDDKGRTALIYASINTDELISRLLLQAGANPDIQDCNGNTALHWLITYARDGRMQTVKQILEAKANPNIKNKRGETVYDDVSCNRHYSFLHGEDNPEMLYMMSLTPTFRNPTDEQALMFLYAACVHGDKNMVDQLLTRSDVKKNLHRNFGNNAFICNIGTVLSHAARRGHRDIVRLLIAQGVNVDADRMTALIRAAKAGYHLIVADLITAGANLELTWGFSNERTALEYAVEYQHPLVIDVLLSAGAIIRWPMSLYAFLEKSDQRYSTLQNSLLQLCKQLSAKLENEIESKNKSGAQSADVLKDTSVLSMIKLLNKVNTHRMGLSALSMFNRKMTRDVIYNALPLLSLDVCNIVHGYVDDGNLLHLEEFTPEEIPRLLPKCKKS
ncbi:MAG: ankyrin repeat domain-containing protein [Gammaproteobacteria bacterium]